MANDLCERCVIYDICDVKDIVAPPPQCQNFVQRPMTHFDQLHAMSVEEMAKALCRSGCPPTVWGKDGSLYCPKPEEEVCEEVCGSCWLDWLRQEVEE